MHVKTLVPLLCSALTVLGCSGDDKKTDPDPTFDYTVPSPLSMTADVGALLQEGAAAPSGICHAAAVVVVAAINLNVAVRLAVPGLTLAACAAQSPAYVGDQTWQWTANGGAGQGAWTAELTGHVAGEAQVEWEMRVNGTPLGLDHFLWFHGTADGAAHDGIWHFNDAARASSPIEIVECTWSLPEDGPRNVAFENTDPESPDTGDRLNYILSGASASVVVFDASLNRSAQIAWDTATGTGNFIGFEGNRCCWDVAPLYADIDCPR